MIIYKDYLEFEKTFFSVFYPFILFAGASLIATLIYILGKKKPRIAKIILDIIATILILFFAILIIFFIYIIIKSVFN